MPKRFPPVLLLLLFGLFAAMQLSALSAPHKVAAAQAPGAATIKAPGKHLEAEGLQQTAVRLQAPAQSFPPNGEKHFRSVFRANSSSSNPLPLHCAFLSPARSSTSRAQAPLFLVHRRWRN